MRLTIFASFFCLIALTIRARSAGDAVSEPTSTAPASPTEIVNPNNSYLLKFDCISCPYLVRHSNYNEWEEDPRPNHLTLTLYIDDFPPRLYLQGDILHPLWYERRVPPFYSSPHPYAPPFAANQIGINETSQREEDSRGYGMPNRQFEVAYEYDMVTYAPKDRPWEWEVLIELEITGLRHEEHVPKDIPFIGNEVDGRTEGSIPGVTSILRLVLEYTGLREMRIATWELMPKESIAKSASVEIEALRKAVELKGEKSIATANWGGRLRDINGPDGKDMYTDHVSFQPGEWNDCGRKGEWGRQIMCKLVDFQAWSPIFFMTLAIIVAMMFIRMFVMVVYASWLAIRIMRGEKTGELVTTNGEGDAFLLLGDEELEYEEEKVDKVKATRTLMNEQKDSEQFGPYQHNLGNNT